MKQINATPAAIEIAADEIKQVLDMVPAKERTYAKWNELREDFLVGYIADAVAYVEEKFIPSWLNV